MILELVIFLLWDNKYAWGVEAFGSLVDAALHKL